MSFVCVAHFIFMANDKPTSGEQMTNTSIMLIETIFIVHRRELSSFRGGEEVRPWGDETVSNSHVQREEMKRASFSDPGWLFFIYCWPTSYCTRSYFTWPRGCFPQTYCRYEEAATSEYLKTGITLIFNFCSISHSGWFQKWMFVWLGNRWKWAVEF